MAAIKTINKIEAMQRLLKDYFEDVLELAESDPRAFGEQSDWAASDPKAFAAHQTHSYRKILQSKKTDELFKMYGEYLEDKREK